MHLSLAAQFWSPTQRRRFQALVWLTVLIAGLIAALILERSTSGQRAMLGMGLALIFLVTVIKSPCLGVPLAISYLLVLGGLRRWLIPIVGFAPNDPLLLVCPAVAILFASHQLIARQLPRDTHISRLIFALLVIMGVQIANPLQGGAAVGLGGAMFYIVPVLWFYIGRRSGSEEVLTRFFWALSLVAVLSAFYGFYQTFFGLMPGEAQWVQRVQYNSLYVDGMMRPFSFLTSSGEYGCILSLGIVFLWIQALLHQRLAIIPIPFLAGALLLLGTRAIMVSTLVACVVIWAVQGKKATSWLPRSALAIVIALGGAIWSLGQVQQTEFDPRANTLLQYSTEGLLNPLDEKKSSVHLHGQMVGNAALSTLKNPLGFGLGSTTIAANKFGSGGGSAEVDVLDLFIALGWAGGIVFLLIVCKVLAAAFHHWDRTRSTPALGLVGLFVVMLGHWFMAGHYGISTIMGFAIGALDALMLQRSHTAGPKIGTAPLESGREVPA